MIGATFITTELHGISERKCGQGWSKIQQQENERNTIGSRAYKNKKIHLLTLGAKSTTKQAQMKK